MVPACIYIFNDVNINGNKINNFDMENSFVVEVNHWLMALFKYSCLKTPAIANNLHQSSSFPSPQGNLARS